MAKKNIIVGIDLGTTYSCVAVYRNRKAEVIFNDQGNRITPSCVSYTDSGILVGDEAQIQMPLNPENTIYDAKRLIGRQFNDPKVQDDIKLWPFKVVGVNKERPQIEVQKKNGKKLIYPEVISALVLGKLKNIAENYLGQKVKDAVVTVPAYFNDAQRRATKDAGLVAGLNVLRIINEPTAAAVAYGLENCDQNKSKNVLVYDLGGGTFDVTVLTIESGIFEVKSAAGDTHLGGQDFTNSMVKYFVEEIKNKTKKNVSENKTAMAYLRSSCEAAKKALSFHKTSKIILNCNEFNYTSTVSKAQFEELNDDLFKSTLVYVQNALDDAKMTVSDIDEVVLVGGSTRIPKIQRLLEVFFKGTNINCSLNPDEGVAIGAAIQAAIMADNSDDKLEDILLVDVTPLSLGILANDSEMILKEIISVIIKRNTVIPVSNTQRYCTAYDNQRAMRVPVYAGEKLKAKDNELLDEFSLGNIPLRPKREVMMDVTFDINADGILTVTAVETSMGIKKSMVVTNIKKHFLEEEIREMTKDVMALTH